MHELGLDHVKGPGCGMQPKALVEETAFQNTISTIIVEKRMLHFLGRELV